MHNETHGRLIDLRERKIQLVIISKMKQNTTEKIVKRQKKKAYQE